MTRYLIILFVAFLCTSCASPSHNATPRFWQLYESELKGAKYVDLTHTITPSIPVWAGFEASVFMPALDPKTGVPYSWL